MKNYDVVVSARWHLRREIKETFFKKETDTVTNKRANIKKILVIKMPFFI